MNSEIHVPLRESPEVKSLWATRPLGRPRPDHSLEERNSLRLGLRIIGRRQPPGAAFGRVLDNTRHFDQRGLCGLRRAPTGLGGERGAVVCSGASLEQERRKAVA